MRKAALFALIGCYLIVNINAMANEKVCSRNEAMQAESDTDTLIDWYSVYMSFKRFAHCDDGSISEGYSETISLLMVNHWEYIQELSNLTKRDKDFEKFVLSHIDETVPAERLDQIIQNCRLHCPSQAQSICTLIYSAAR